MDTELLNAVVIKGIAETGAIADALDIPRDRAGQILADLADRGLIRHRAGRISGWGPTESGRAERTRLMRAQRLELPDETAYATFVEANAELKSLCTEWQTTDTRNPADFGDRLADIHARILEILDVFQQLRPRFAAYTRRLTTARERFLAGDETALTGLDPDSYHSVWMELHSDILATLDRPRTAADGS